MQVNLIENLKEKECFTPSNNQTKLKLCDSQKQSTTPRAHSALKPPSPFFSNNRNKSPAVFTEKVGSLLKKIYGKSNNSSQYLEVMKGDEDTKKDQITDRQLSRDTSSQQHRQGNISGERLLRKDLNISVERQIEFNKKKSQLFNCSGSKLSYPRETDVSVGRESSLCSDRGEDSLLNQSRSQNNVLQRLLRGNSTAEKPSGTVISSANCRMIVGSAEKSGIFGQGVKRIKLKKGGTFQQIPLSLLDKLSIHNNNSRLSMEDQHAIQSTQFTMNNQTDCSAQDITTLQCLSDSRINSIALLENRPARLKRAPLSNRTNEQESEQKKIKLNSQKSSCERLKSSSKQREKQIPEFEAVSEFVVVREKEINEISRQEQKNNQNSSLNLVKDSKIEEILMLRKQNAYLQSEVKELQTELEELDEFKIVIEKVEKDRDECSFYQKRVLLLKACIHKQKRHIKTLTNMLQTARHSTLQFTQLANTLIEGSAQVQFQRVKQKRQEQEQQIRRQITVNFNEKQKIKVLQQQHQDKLAYEQNLIQSDNINQNSNKINDDDSVKTTCEIGIQTDNYQGNEQTNLEEFYYQEKGRNLSESFEEIAERFKRDTMLPKIDEQTPQFNGLPGVDENNRDYSDDSGFSDVFHVISKKSENNLKNPFCQSPSTIAAVSPVGCIEVQFSYPLDSYLTKNEPQARKEIAETFEKLTDLNQGHLFMAMSQLHKTNQAFRKLRTFQLLKNSEILFKEHDGSVSLPSILINNKSGFQQWNNSGIASSEAYQLDIKHLQRTETSLNLVLDNLLALMSQLIGKGEFSEEGSELIKRVRRACEDIGNLGLLAEANSGDFAQKISVHFPQETSGLSKKSKSQPKQLLSQPQHLQESNIECSTQFFQKKIALQELILSRQIPCNEEVQQKVNDILDSFTNIFEAKNNLLKLREAEILFLRGRADLAKKETTEVKEFLDEIQRITEQTILPIHSRVAKCLQSFNGLVITRKIEYNKAVEEFSVGFQNQIQEALQMLESIIQPKDKTTVSRLFDLQYLFQSRLTLVLSRFKSISPSIFHKII